MNASQIIVTAAGIAAIAWVNWFFLLSRERSVRAGSGSGVQEIAIRVSGGYEPARIVVRAGEPVRLVFRREETASCTEEVVLPDFGLRRRLPAFQATAVEFTPERPGTYPFSCGMNMVRGEIIATEDADG